MSADRPGGDPAGAPSYSGYFLGAAAMHAQLLNGAERERSFVGRKVQTLETSFYSYTVRDAVFTRGTTSWVTGTGAHGDVGADLPAYFGANAGDAYSAISRRSLPLTDSFTGGDPFWPAYIPDRGPNGSHAFFGGISATDSSEIAWRFATDPFFRGAR
jgi:hypothetical protein